MTMKNRVCSAIMALFIFYAMAANAMAADYSFTTDAPQDYYGDTSYEDIYGSQYNYGGPNVVDFQIPELEYGLQSTTMTGVMEWTMLPGLQHYPDGRYGTVHPAGPTAQRGNYGGCGRLRRQRGRYNRDLRRPVYRFHGQHIPAGSDHQRGWSGT